MTRFSPSKAPDVRAGTARIVLPSGKPVVDYDMAGGALLAGHRVPDVVDAVKRALSEDAEIVQPDFGYPARCYFDAPTAVDAVAGLGGYVVVDCRQTWHRVELPERWDFAVAGDSAASGLPFGVVLARTPALTDLLPGLPGAHVLSLAAARALEALVGGLVVTQLSGRAQRLAAGVAEVCAGVGLEVVVDQPGGLLQLTFARPDLGATFAAEMLDRGFLVRTDGAWYPSLAHDFYDIEATIDAAAAAAWAAMGRPLIPT